MYGAVKCTRDVLTAATATVLSMLSVLSVSGYISMLLNLDCSSLEFSLSRIVLFTSASCKNIDLVISKSLLSWGPSGAAFAALFKIQN